MLILAERTPNPDALKFLPQMQLTDGRCWGFARGDESPVVSPLALGLFALPSVTRVYIGEDFITVIRAPDGEAWTTLRIQVVAAIADVLGEGHPAVRAPDASPPAPAADVEAEIRAVLDRHVRPGVARDGGDIVFERLDAAGVLWVRMEGACGGCPSSRRTLKDAVERTVRRYVPEVTAVAEATSPANAPRPSSWRRWLGAAPLPSAGPRPVFRHNGRPFRN